jgi:hypothetical protein
MKLRNMSLLALFTVLCAWGIQAQGNNPFAPDNNPLPSPQTESDSPSPFAKESEETPEPANPFASTAPLNNQPTTSEPTNPFAPATPSPSEDAPKEPADPEDSTPLPMTKGHETSTPLPPGHLSTAQRTASIKTVDITPGHSATLDPLTPTHGVETERYFIQDKKYESYLSNYGQNGPQGTTLPRTYQVTIPATVHVGSFTVFKVQGMQGIPDHLEPAYHITIQGNAHLIGEGTQYPEAQPSTAVEKLTQLEDNYLMGMQTQFKTFTQEVRDLISTAHRNGESLETAKLHEAQTITTNEPLSLRVGESHVVTSFTGGSTQSSNPAIVSAVLKFEGTKTAPQWKLVLTGQTAGEAVITYSTGSKSHVQPVSVTEKSPFLPVSKTEPQTTSAPEESVKPTLKKELRTVSESDDAEQEESEEKDEKTAHKLSEEDEPFASFLKDTSKTDSTADDEESSEIPVASTESTDSEDESSDNEPRANRVDEESTEEQDEDK